MSAVTSFQASNNCIVSSGVQEWPVAHGSLVIAVIVNMTWDNVLDVSVTPDWYSDNTSPGHVLTIPYIHCIVTTHQSNDWGIHTILPCIILQLVSVHFYLFKWAYLKIVDGSLVLTMLTRWQSQKWPGQDVSSYPVVLTLSCYAAPPSPTSKWCFYGFDILH